MPRAWASLGSTSLIRFVRGIYPLSLPRCQTIPLKPPPDRRDNVRLRNSMRFTYVVAIGALVTATATASGPAAGTGTIVLGSYSGNLTAIDEATEKVVA